VQVWGGQNILYAYNTLYMVGSRSHTIEVLLGSRSCDGNATACSANNAQGAWGPPSPTDTPADIPNDRVMIVDNLIYNPPPYQSQWQQISVQGPAATRAGYNVPGSMARADVDLVFQGNIFWNGDASMPIGVEDGNGECAASNPTCNLAQLKAQNAFNTIDPQLTAYNSQ